jgi:hypothetical protein
MEETKNNQPSGRGYYINKKREIIDFLIGVFIAILALGSIAFGLPFYLVPILVYFIAKDRLPKYIFRGIKVSYIAFFIYFALVLGGCFLAMYGK